MIEIDQSTWPRREHYAFFRRMDYPVYNVCFDLDITDFQPAAKTRGLSFNHAMLHVSTRAANAVENLRYRIRGDSVVLHDGLHPSFAWMNGETDLFKLVTMDFQADLAAFDRAARLACASQREYFPLEKLQDRDDFIFFSSLPWISFTGLDHTMNLRRDDAIPRITWGRFFERGGRTLLPYNVQVNHCFVDGCHVGRFKEALDACLAEVAAEVAADRG
jgi:chloramphenicol O-acetyltransferase type A